jgi:hypothetical protein
VFVAAHATETGGMFTTLARTSISSLPWLASLLFAAGLTYGLGNVAASAALLPEEPAAYSETCAGAADRMLVYAVSTQRVPATISAECRLPAAPM